jgi:hypothetical protein
MEQRKIRLKFNTFRNEFLGLISSRHFGEPPHHMNRKTNREEGAAYKELKKTGLSLRLHKVAFLLSLHQIVEEHGRLEAEQAKVREVARKIRPLVGRYRYAQKRLERIKRDLEECDSKYVDLLDFQLRDHILSAVQNVDDAKGVIRRRERLEVSKVHPTLRKKKDDGDWESLFKGYDYGLETLHVRAADQWLWRELSHLFESYKEDNSRRLSAMTMFKLISAVCKAAGIGTFEPTAIKEYLYKHPETKPQEKS